MAAWKGLEEKLTLEEREQQRLNIEIRYAEKRAIKACIIAAGWFIFGVVVAIFVSKELLFVPVWMLVFVYAPSLWYVYRAYIAYRQRNLHKRENNAIFAKRYKEAAMKDD